MDFDTTVKLEIYRSLAETAWMPSSGSEPAYTRTHDRVTAMSKIEALERQIKQLSEAELSELRRWFADFDAEAWDRQFQADVEAGKLDALAEKALRAHAVGESTRI